MPRPPLTPLVKRERSSQACQSCRNLKASCSPSSHIGTCQRCLDFKRQCIWAVTETRSKKPRVPSRISQVERKLDGLVAHFADNRTPVYSTPSTEPLASPNSRFQLERQSRNSIPLTPTSAAPLNHSDTDLDPGRCLAELAEIHNFGSQHPYENASNTPMGGSRGHDSLADDLKDLLNGTDYTSLFDAYRSMSASFPFVPIAPGLNVDEVRKRKPMLLLAIMSAATWKTRKLQVTLEERYRREIANRTVIEPRKSVSLVQSMLLYLSWYHFYFNHKIQNIYPILQLLVGITMDLGLHQKSKQSPLLNKSKPEISSEEEREEQRTLLGCYYLSSAISHALQKPNLFPYTQYMSECLDRLQIDLEFVSDGTLSSLINARQLEDRLFDVCGSISLDAQYLPSLTDIQGRLVELNNAIDGEGNERLTGLLLQYSTMVLYSFQRKAETTATLYSDSHSEKELAIVLSMVEAGRSVLDFFVDCPVSEYCLISFVEWIRLPHVIITLSKVISLAQDGISQSDYRGIQDRVRLELYLESLCYRMQTLTTFDPQSQPQPDFWMAMKVIMDKMRDWFTRRMHRGRVTCRPEVASDVTNFEVPDVPVSSDQFMPPAHTDTGAPFMPDIDFSLDEFMQMDFWGGPASYDPTIERSDWG